MANTTTGTEPTATELEQMHAFYRQGGLERQMAPHVLYAQADCPHSPCDQRMQAIDFRLESYGPAVHDPLVRAWWNDTGFAARCPTCGGWIHFTIRGKRAIDAAEADQLSKLPENWHENAIIL